MWRPEARLELTISVKSYAADYRYPTQTISAGYASGVT